MCRTRVLKLPEDNKRYQTKQSKKSEEMADNSTMGSSSIEDSNNTTGGSHGSITTGFKSRNSRQTNKSGSQSQLTQRRPDHVKSRASEIQTFRILLCGSLLILASVLGVCVYFFFKAPEANLAAEQFKSIAGRATSYAQQTTRLKRLGVITMATMIGIDQPNAEEWPFVLVDGYDQISSRLVQTISGDGMGFAPIVAPGELADFEAFAYESYNTTLGYPNTTAVSGFGKGVWAKDGKGEFGIEHPDQKYHEGIIHPNAETSYGSPYEIYAPVLQHSAGANANPLLLNLHNEKNRGQTIDSILACSKNSSNLECGQMTNMLLLTERRMPARDRKSVV